MTAVFICDSVRTPVGRYGGALATIRTDDLAALPLKALIERNPTLDLEAVNDVLFGCANQAGEDNRNVARMALLLAGLPASVAGSTINRLCGSGMDSIGTAGRAIKAGEADLIIAGGVESMSRAPFVLSKSTTAFSRSAKMFDTTIGWRFINKLLEQQYGSDSMPETAENLAREFKISREDQDRFALWSQQKTAAAQADGRLAEEITPVSVPHPRDKPQLIYQDEHPRLSSLEKLSSLRSIVGKDGNITAGNASGINDGAAAVILASEEAVNKYGLKARARLLGMEVAGVLPRVMGLGPINSTNKLLGRIGLKLDDISIIELNEAFSAQALVCLRELGLADDDPRINPQGGAIALGHPLGMSGTRLTITATHQLQRGGGRYALCTMCVGVGQGISIVLERV